jgi:dipeptidyl aminopeptidase/acylaminoacyl peptidase
MIKQMGMRARLLLAASLAFLETVPALSQESPEPIAAATRAGQIPTSAFASRSAFGGMPMLSPDGERVAFSLTEDEENWVGVLNIDDAKLEQKISLRGSGEPQWIGWAGNGQVLVSTAQSAFFPALGLEFRFGRVIAVEIASGTVRQVASGSEDIVHVDPEGAYLLVSRERRGASRDVWRTWIDGNDRPDEQITNEKDVFEWLADDSGTVRIGLGVDGRRLKVWYRRAAEEPFRLIGKLRPGDAEEMWEVVRLIADSDEGLTLEPGSSGRIALRKFNYATREAGEVVFENAEWDIEDFEVDDQGRPMAVYFTDDRERIVWLDPETARMQDRLERALGDGGQVRILQRSRAGERILISNSSASNPGSWYLYTPAERKLEEFAKLRPEVDAANLASVESVEYTARDGTTINAYLTLPQGREPKALPLIVLPHGGPFGVRDKLEYSDEVQLLANRGYAVLQPNYRGSSGYGDAFAELGRGEIGRRMQDDLDDAVDWAAGEGLVDPTRVCLVGASYGGYAALWGVIRNPERYRCAASFAGVTEWDKQIAYDRSFIDGSGARAWRERIRGEDRAFDLDLVSPARQAARLRRPVLLVHGRRDSNVPFRQFELMRSAIERARVRDAEFLVFEKSGHAFSSAEDEQAWYDALTAFLARHNPAD